MMTAPTPASNAQRRESRPVGTVAVWRLLAAVALAVAIPLTLFTVLIVGDFAREANEAARNDVEKQAEFLANRLDDMSREVQAVLNVLGTAIGPTIRTTQENDSLLAAVAQRLPRYIQNLGLYDLRGNNIGHSSNRAPVSQRPNVGDRRFFIDAMSSGRFAVGDPVISRIDGRPVLGFAYPLRNSSGEIVAIASASSTLRDLLPLLGIPPLPDSSVVTVVDTGGLVIARTLDPDRWITRNIRGTPIIDSLIRARRATATFTGGDSITRHTSVVPTRDFPWIVVVGVPIDVVGGRARALILRSAVVGGLALLFGLGLSLLFARRVGRPIAELTEAAVALREGDSARRVDADGSGALRPLAHAFNTLADELDVRAAAVISKQQAIEETERNYRLLFERNPAAMWVFDDETLQFLAVNEATVQQYGYTREEFLSMTLEEIRPPEDIARLREMRATAKVEGLRAPGIFRHLRHDGSVILADIVSQAITYQGRRARLTLATDVTERVQLEDQLRQSQKLEAVGQLAGGIAHDFNNLLTVILSYTSFAEEEVRRGTVTPDTADSLTQIAQAARRAAELTRNLLSFARRQVLTRSIVNVNDSVQRVERLLTRMLGEHIEFRTQLAKDIWLTEADSGQVEQVLVNLAVNARDAMPQGGIIEMSTANYHVDPDSSSLFPSMPAGDYVSVTVSDTGEGMAADMLAKIFEPFFTTKAVGAGTGLGLSVCYGIAKQHGGDLTVYSEEDVGSTFRLYLPRARESIPTPSESAPALVMGGTETILLVEDAEQVRNVAEQVLRANGYTVVTAVDGEDGLRMAEQHDGAIDLLLTDMVMPRMSGADLAGKLRERWPELPVVYSSGYSHQLREGRDAISSGAFLPKPFLPQTLLVTVRAALDEQRHERTRDLITRDEA